MPDITAESAKSALDSVFAKDTSVALAGAAEPVITEEQTKTEPPEKKEEKIEPVDEDTPPSALPNDGRKDIWKEFTGKYDEKKKELKTLREEIKGFEGTKAELATLKAEREELQKQVQELGKIDSMSKLERSPAFVAKYVTAREEQIGLLKKTAQQANLAESELLAALNKSPLEKAQALDELTGTLPSSFKNKILNAFERIEGIDEARQQEIYGAEDSLKKLTMEQERSFREEHEKLAKDRQAAFDTVLNRIGKELKLDKAGKENARKFFLENDSAEAAAEIVLRGEDHKLTAKERTALETELTELKAELQQYRGGDTALTSGTDAGRKSSDKRDFATAIADGLKAAGFAR